MAYFLKQTKQKRKNGKTVIYLAIYESFYSHEKKGTAHKCFKSLGSIEKIKESGIADPVAYYKDYVDSLNSERNERNTLKIGETSPMKYLGYFPLKNILDDLNVRKDLNLFDMITDYQFSLYDLLSSLIYARSVCPCSKRRTFNEILPQLFESYDYTYDQLLEGLSFFGNDYEKIIEMFTIAVSRKYGIETDKTYFDCTNFFFEIDRQDDFRRNGPSKENRRSPIVGMGLLLDANQIPIGMKMYPGNESEKPVMRDIIDSLKSKHSIKGKTVHVADKGLNCATNIVKAKLSRDGYLFSKSVKQLPETEKNWVLSDKDYVDVKDDKGNVLYRYKSCVDKFPYTVKVDGKNQTVRLPEKRLVTYNEKLARKKKAEIRKMVDKASNMCLSQAKRSQFGDTSKYVSFTDEEGKNAKAVLNEKNIEKDLKLAGYNLLVTSEIDMKDRDIYRTYHNLWKIEESFRIMKSDLDARPVYLQKENTIKGHFLICYLTVLLERILQYKILKEKYSSTEIFDFIRKFKVVKNDRGYTNVTMASDFIRSFDRITNLRLMNYYLSEKNIEMILKHRF